MAGIPGHRVVVFLQENKTTDFYFPSLAAWGAAVANHGALLPAPPNFDQPHDRNAWVHYAMGDYPALAVQLDNDHVIPFYSYLAKEFVFADHHFGAGSNSTSGHMLAVGGQMPTMKNPPFVGPHPNEFIPMAKAGLLPEVVYAWSPAGYDEHPPFVSDPSYITNGQNLVWDRVQAVIDGGGWENTTFILTWDDRGRYAASIPPPAIETVPDAVHPAGFAAIGGSRIPLIMFGGKVAQQIDPEWHSHASIPKTIIDLLGLPPLGVPRVDAAPSLAHYVHKALTRPAPPTPGSSIIQPVPPSPRPQPVPPKPWAGALGRPLPPPPPRTPGG